MAGESQVTFASVEERDKAIDGFDENEGSVDDLQKIRNAEIVPGKAEETTDTQEEEVKTEEVEETTTTQEEEKVEDTTTTPEEKEAEKTTATSEEEVSHETFTIKKEDLPLNYDTPGKVFKSVQEKEDLIKRQAAKIQELIEQQGQREQQLGSALTQAQSAQAQVEKETGVEEAKIEVSESKLSEIALKQKTLSEMADPYSEEGLKLQNEINGLNLNEITRLTNLTKSYQDEFKALKASTEEIKEGYRQELQKDKDSVALEKEYKQIDSFTSDEKYKEDFALSKSSKEVESDYIAWGTQVATQYYARLPQSMEEVNYALNALFMKSPDLVSRCELAQIPIEPNEDLRKYIDIIKLMDYRDGWREDTTGKKYRVTKYDGYTKKDIPDTLPSIEAALEHQRIASGYYKKKELDAYNKGGKDAVAAMSKRDNNELDNVHAGRGAEETLTKEQAAKRLDEIDEMEAQKMYKDGDPSLVNEMSKLRQQLGGGAIDMTL